MPKTSSGEIDTPKVGSFHNSDNLKCEIDHDRGDCAYTIKKSLAGNSIALDDESSDTMKIFLQLDRGETFALVVNSFGNIGYLKMMVHNKKGIPPHMQRIFFGVKELEVDKTLLDYGVHNRAKLYLLDTRICVMSERITSQVQVELSDTIKSVDQLKKEIENVRGRMMQWITYRGKQLEDGHSLSHYGIKRKATIDISITDLEVFKVKMMPKTSSGEIDTPKVGSFHNIDEKSSDTKDSQKVIQYKEGESVLQSHIYGSSKQVEVEIPGCNINNESNPFSMNISVKFQTGKTVTFVVNRFDTIASLKVKIFRMEDIPKDWQRIIFSGKQLEDEKLFFDYGVREDSELHMVLRLRGGGGQLSIIKKRATYHYQVEISGTVDSVDSLKEKIAQEMTIPPAKQTIMYEGQQLEDEHSLSDYGIQGGAIVDVSFTNHRVDEVEKKTQTRGGLFFKVVNCWRFKRSNTIED